MSGDASKSKGQKKAGSAASSAAAKKNAANLKYASKKSKAEKKKEQNLQKMSKSRCCSWSTLFYLLILTGAGMAAVKQYPDKVQELYDNLPPQVSLKWFWACTDVYLSSRLKILLSTFWPFYFKLLFTLFWQTSISREKLSLLCTLFWPTSISREKWMNLVKVLSVILCIFCHLSSTEGN